MFRADNLRGRPCADECSLCSNREAGAVAATEEPEIGLTRAGGWQPAPSTADVTQRPPRGMAKFWFLIALRHYTLVERIDLNAVAVVI